MDARQWERKFGAETQVAFEHGIVLAPHTEPFEDSEEELYVMAAEGANDLVRGVLRQLMDHFGNRRDVTGFPLDELDAYDILKQVIDAKTYLKMKP